MENVNNEEFIDSIKITRIKDFCKIVKEEVNNTEMYSSRCVYRGQSDCAWDLKSSLERHPDFKKHDIERKIYHDICKYSYLDGIICNDEYVLDNQIKMQHYGIPTRFLDWTYNPLVALYFSLADEEKDGCVFVLKPSKIIEWNDVVGIALLSYLNVVLSYDDIKRKDEDEVAKSLINKNGGNVIFLNTRLQNARINAQQGLFSFCVDDDKRNFVDDFKKEYARELKFFSRENIDRIEFLFKNNKADDVGESIRKSEINDETITEYIKEYLEKYNGRLRKNEENELQKCKRIIIPKENKKSIKNDLDKIMGVNALMVYPDSRGLGEYIREKYKFYPY